jgi:hypothetical protein
MDEDDPFKDISPHQFLAWLEAQPPEFRTRMLETILRRGPEAQIEAVKSLRAIAADPNASDKARDEAKWILKKTGFEDESSRKDKGKD